MRGTHRSLSRGRANRAGLPGASPAELAAVVAVDALVPDWRDGLLELLARSERHRAAPQSSTAAFGSR